MEKAASEPALTRARVLLDGRVDLLFDYGIPEELAGQISPGSRVSVPLRARQASGWVLETVGNDGSVKGLKMVTRLLPDGAALTPELIKLGQWLATYYLAPVSSVLMAMSPQSTHGEKNGFQERLLVRLKVSFEEASLAAEQLGKKAPRQSEVLRELVAAGGSMALTALTESISGAHGIVRALEVRGLVESVKVVKHRDPLAKEEYVADKAPDLTEEQRAALKQIKESWSADVLKPVLLHGVTGSGKTEIYLQLIERVRAQGKSAIVLVPEISLTPQTAERFKARFAGVQDQIAVLHSGLSKGEWHDEWHKLRAAHQSIAIGPRSAVFAPVNRLGLIIVDEEHESSYKQDHTPRYHGRDAAIVRASIENCPVVLASATPSLESYQRVLDGKFHLVQLKQRVDGRSLPLIRVVDMRLGSVHRGNKVDDKMFSMKLRLAIESRLEKGEQSILFLNRRGFSRLQTCQECSFTVVCDHCSVALPFHKGDSLLICHICGFRRLPMKSCPECLSTSMSFGGYGTEKVQEVADRIFPLAKIARVDSDTMRRKDRLRETFRDFRAGRIQILIGTQMIAKGLDFPNVTLVGVLNADTALHMPDFRAAERTFQQLVQVAGRAGRGEMEGEVFVQTFSPHSAAVRYARHHDFEGFAEEELETRKHFGFPPLGRIVLIRVRSEDQKLAEMTLERVVQRELKRDQPDFVTLGEPSPSPLEKSHGQFHFQILARSMQARGMLAWIRAALERVRSPKGVVIQCDVDPYSFS